MTWWFPIGLAGFVLLGYLANRLGWIDLSNKNHRPGGGGSIVSIGDEIFAPARHEAAIELDRQSVLPAPAPIAGDPAADKVYDGRITIELKHDELRNDRRPGPDPS